MLRMTCWAASLALTALIGLGCGNDTGTDIESDDMAPVEATDVTTPDVVPVEGDVTTEPADAVITESADDVTTEPAGDAVTEPAGDAAAANVELSEEDIAQIQKLPADDVVLALAQKVCPASGEPLGSMGVPIKVEAGDKDIFVCCKGCVDEVKADPEKYLAKVESK